MKKKLLIGAGVLALLIAIIGFQIFKSNQETALRQEATQAQRQELIDYWQAEGLSEEKIEQKLQAEMLRNPEDRDASFFFSMFRSVRQATGTTGGGGGGMGTGK